jgi:hypothetical protein
MIEATLRNRVSQYKRLHDFFIKINLFDDKEALSLADQILATRIFLSLFVITLSIVIIFTAFSLRTQTLAILLPSETIFNQFSIQYPSTLSCPCKQSSIDQDKFLSFNP